MTILTTGGIGMAGSRSSSRKSLRFTKKPPALAAFLIDRFFSSKLGFLLYCPCAHSPIEMRGIMGLTRFILVLCINSQTRFCKVILFYRKFNTSPLFAASVDSLILLEPVESVCVYSTSTSSVNNVADTPSALRRGDSFRHQGSGK